MISVRKAKSLNICSSCYNKCDLEGLDECILIPEVILEKALEQKSGWDRASNYDPEITRVLQEGWRKCPDKSVPIQTFEAGFWTCHEWINGRSKDFYCNKCRIKSYPNRDYCPFCGCKNINEKE